MDDLRAVLGTLLALRTGRLAADQFVERYIALWRRVRDEQTAAIENDPRILAAVGEWETRLSADETTANEFRAGVQTEYARLTGLSVRPGTPSSQVLNDLMGVADGFRARGGAPGVVYIMTEQLLTPVDTALTVLDPGAAPE